MTSGFFKRFKKYIYLNTQYDSRSMQLIPLLFFDNEFIQILIFNNDYLPNFQILKLFTPIY